MKNRIITDIEQGMQGLLDNAQMKQLHEVLTHALFGVEIVTTDESSDLQQEFDNHSLLSTFLSAKKVEGCSEKTLKYYKATIERMFVDIKESVSHITTDDLRDYLANYQQINDCSKANIDNIRRILSSFFA